MHLSKGTVIWVTIFIALFLVTGTGCSRSTAIANASPVSAAKAEETWNFWDAMNNAVVGGTGIEALSEANEDDLKPDVLADIIRDLAACEDKRTRLITSLPVLHVDSNLTAYAIQLASVRSDAAATLLDYANILDQQQSLVSGESLGFTFIMNLLNHRNDKEGVVWNALLETATQTGKEVQQAKPAIQQLTKRASTTRDNFSRLKSEEMRVRVELARRFAREFPPLETYLTQKLRATNAPPSDEQLMHALIGRGIDGWTFDAPSEFVSFKVVNATYRTNGLVDSEVQTQVKGQYSGNRRDFRLMLSARKNITRWQLVEVKSL